MSPLQALLSVLLFVGFIAASVGIWAAGVVARKQRAELQLAARRTDPCPDCGEPVRHDGGLFYRCPQGHASASVVVGGELVATRRLGETR